MEYTSDRKNKADSQITKATKRFKAYKAKKTGDYGNVPAEYAKAAAGPTYDHEMRSGKVIEDTDMKLETLLRNVLSEAVAFDEAEEPKVCFCGHGQGSHTPAGCRACKKEGVMNHANASHQFRPRAYKFEAEGDPTQATVPQTKCAVCGSGDHPASKHTAKALSAENNIGESATRKKGASGNPINQKGSLLKQLLKKMKISEKEVPSPEELQKATIDKPLGKKKVLDELGEATAKTGFGWNHMAAHLNNFHEGWDYSAGTNISQPIARKDTDGKHYFYMGTEVGNGKGARYHHHDGKKLHTKFGDFGTPVHAKSADHQDEIEKQCGAHHKGFSDRTVTEARSKGPKWDGNKLTIKSTPEDLRRKSAATVGMPPPKKVITSKKDKPAKYKPSFDQD